MNAEELKHKLKELFGEQVMFNKDFDNYANTIKNLDVNLIEWCQAVKEGELVPIRAKKDKKTLIFIKKIGSSNRCLILKILNDNFKEIHLGDHKYYNELTKKLGIKKSSNIF